MQPVATNTAIAAKNRLSCISGGMVVFPSPEHHSDKGYRYPRLLQQPRQLGDITGDPSRLITRQ